MFIHNTTYVHNTNTKVKYMSITKKNHKMSNTTQNISPEK